MVYAYFCWLVCSLVRSFIHSAIASSAPQLPADQSILYFQPYNHAALILTDQSSMTILIQKLLLTTTGNLIAINESIKKIATSKTKGDTLEPFIF